MPPSPPTTLVCPLCAAPLAASDGAALHVSDRASITHRCTLVCRCGGRLDWYPPRTTRDRNKPVDIRATDVLQSL